MKKYFLMILYSLIYSGKNRKEIFIRSLFFLVILYIFSKLWQATHFVDATNQQTMIWYLSITEIIILSVPLIQIDIENDIRTGDVVYQLLKPISYFWLKISECVGGFIFRFVILLLIAIPFCTYLSGFRPSISVLCASYLAAGGAGLVFIFFHVAIGLLAFKLQDSSPIFWVWQRFSLFLGGVIIPLSFYPAYLKTVSSFLPFSALLYGPAKLVMTFSVESFVMVLSGVLFWGIAALLLSSRLYVRMLRAIKVNGG